MQNTVFKLGAYVAPARCLHLHKLHSRKIFPEKGEFYTEFEKAEWGRIPNPKEYRIWQGFFAVCTRTRMQ